MSTLSTQLTWSQFINFITMEDSLKKEKKAEPVETESKLSEEVLLLQEIRDLLKNKEV